MSRVCQCRRGCKHVVRGSGDPLLHADRLAALAPFTGLLVDAADAFDSETLTFRADCALHGVKPTPDSECICPGRRYTAAEFVQALILDVRASSAPLQHGPRYEAPSQDRRARWDRKQRQQRRARLDVAV